VNDLYSDRMDKMNWGRITAPEHAVTRIGFVRWCVKLQKLHGIELGW